MPPFLGGGTRLFFIITPSRCKSTGSMAVLLYQCCIYATVNETHQVFRPQTLPASTRLFALIFRISKRWGEASSHPRHSDNKLHRGRASGTPSKGKLHEHEQTCHNNCPVIRSPGSHKELAAEALSLHLLSRRGGMMEAFFCFTYQPKHHYLASYFSTQTGKP